jgi:hypothetical protein
MDTDIKRWLIQPENRHLNFLSSVFICVHPWLNILFNFFLIWPILSHNKILQKILALTASLGMMRPFFDIS